MGNSCCNNAEKDAHLKDFSNTPQKKGEQSMAEVDPETLKRAAENEEKIVKLQAQTRGFLARKHMKDDKSESYDRNKPKQSSRTS